MLNPIRQHLAKLCDDKKRPPHIEGDDADTLAGSASKLLLSSPFPTLAEFRLRMVRQTAATSQWGPGRAGLLYHSIVGDTHTTQTFQTRHIPSPLPL